eukprot:TRINITY_DN2058_c0_g2_i1.p1 TRINITY_DN2058_c0_g2~~TRINITY_DN2058_c0_g2_i1.p1  ORF type:complete len:460 (+),score=118.67 TRINITY_DN2058_c0_g2_i1:58-1437(+)
MHARNFTPFLFLKLAGMSSSDSETLSDGLDFYQVKPAPTAAEQPVEPPKPKLTHAERVAKYREAVDKAKLNLDEIQKLAHQGVPDELRAVYWKILLGYLPTDKSLWEETLKKQRQLYSQWHLDLIVNPRKELEEREAEEKKKQEENEELEEIMPSDHPLSRSSGSEWNEYFKDSDMIYEIEKDVSRTFPHLHFFQLQSAVVSPSNQKLNKLHAKTRITTAEDPLTTNIHYQALRSILFMWAKLNPGIAYVQGMNEILAPIYYIFANNSDLTWQEHAEADAFFCFTNLMSEIMNNFCKSLDSSRVGIKEKIKELNNLLKEKDPELWYHFDTLQLDPQFYSFRWLTLLLSQEFELPDTMRLWDCLFSDKSRFNHLLNVCVAMIVIKREDFLSYDFANSLKTLQKYPPIDINNLLALADEVADKNYRASSFLLPSEKPQAQAQASGSIMNALTGAWGKLLKF